ncbi:MAG: TIGR03936 family radical SAM-associated protein, partial [Lachnospiraceae bacterium]|nr:TIGR03936 family radical SAM-associated protein [Lachnospiraceae bacterium]
ERLNQASVPEIKIVSVKKLPPEAGNAMASVSAAKYFVTLREDREVPILSNGPDAVKNAISEFLSQDQILYEKESKKGTREVDLKPGIFGFEWLDDKGGMEMLLDASSGDNIKPSQVLDAMLKQLGRQLPENCLRVTRIDTYTRTAEEGDRLGELISMDDVGEIF